jgi:guanylate kinase
MPTRLTVLSGPSGVGKGTVVAAVRTRYPHVWVSVSCTTRPPRPGEREGVQYYFVTDTEFDRQVEAGELLEHAEFAGHRYGTPRAAVEAKLRAGTPTLLEIDLQGARQVRTAMPEVLLVFLAPPSWTELERRLATRGTESGAGLSDRLARAQIEMAAQGDFDAVVINDDVPRAAAELVALIDGDGPSAPNPS